ncbi:uncharacterized protein LOC143200480 isoform X2 [Rhynchophorus ferrugineus]|uniref:uncharacterized protein LOC143200480 isoform X2 n=1 Tax=Rhynchophorus ferrugineus TaxID=354439 RepID=UPI003FCD750F
MYLEEAVFKHLTCSQCSKYLSISPIKVYPDRSIKCRCGKADDGGVESQLYNLIIKDAIFPCVNSFDGCPEMRTLSTMSAHEQTCRTEEYSCQLCAAFVGSASSLYFHCKNSHPAQSLDNSEFLVDVDKDGRDIRYFYSSGRKLFFISGRYESSRSEININLSYFGKHFKGDMKYTLRFKTIEGTILYGSKQYPCSIMHQEMAEAIKYTVDTSNLPKNILICTFDVYEKPALVYNEIPSIIGKIYTYLYRGNVLRGPTSTQALRPLF